MILPAEKLCPLITQGIISKPQFDHRYYTSIIVQSEILDASLHT